MRSFDISYYTCINLGVLIPLEVHISKIRESSYYEIPQYKTIEYNNDNSVSITDGYSHGFIYGKFKEVLQLRFILGIVYDFIDMKTIKQIKNLKNYFAITKEEFIDFILQSFDISITQIRNEYRKLLKYIQYIKKEFDDIAIEQIGIIEYPEIKLKDDLIDEKTMKKYEPYLKLSDVHVSLSSAIKDFGVVLFDENIGKAWESFSWREIRIRKLLSKKTNDIDSFIERIKSKAIEDKRKEDDNS